MSLAAAWSRSCSVLYSFRRGRKEEKVKQNIIAFVVAVGGAALLVFVVGPALNWW